MITNKINSNIENLIHMDSILIPLKDIMKYKDFLMNFAGVYCVVSIEDINKILYCGEACCIFTRWVKDTLDGFDSAHLYSAFHIKECYEKLTPLIMSLYIDFNKDISKYFLKLYRIDNTKLRMAFEKYMITKYIPYHNTSYVRDSDYNEIDRFEIERKNIESVDTIQKILEYGDDFNSNVNDINEKTYKIEIVNNNDDKKDINAKMKQNAIEFEKNNIGSVSSSMKKGCLIIKHSTRKYDNNMQLFIPRYLIENLEREYELQGKNIYDYIKIRDPGDPKCGSYTFNSKKINVTNRTSDASKRNFRAFFETIDKYIQCEFRIENVFKLTFIETFGKDYNTLKHKVIFFEDNKRNNVV